jgi:hypothetical protein
MDEWLSAKGCERRLFRGTSQGFLSELQMPDESKDTAVNAVGELLGQENLDERIQQIKGIIERLDFAGIWGSLSKRSTFKNAKSSRRSWRNCSHFRKTKWSRRISG